MEKKRDNERIRKRRVKQSFAEQSVVALAVYFRLRSSDQSSQVCCNGVFVWEEEDRESTSKGGNRTT